MCLQIEAGIVEHIQVEVRSANNSIYMDVFYFYLFQIIILVLLINPQSFLFYLISGECTV